MERFEKQMLATDDLDEDQKEPFLWDLRSSLMNQPFTR